MWPRVVMLIGVVSLSACEVERRPGGAQNGRVPASGDAATHATDGGTTITPDVGVGPDGGQCGDVLEDEDNCGACGRACAGSCSGGVCTAIGLDWLDSVPTGLRFLRTEVTVEQFAACVRAGPCAGTLDGGGTCNYGSGRPTLPMNCVDWTGADRFCTWSGGRLPTEDEWYAEASNNGTRDYPWGADPASCARAVMGPDGCSTGGTEPVCSRLSGNSVSGLCDMSGNVWEWTSTQTQGGPWRVIRGGDWRSTDQSILRASARGDSTPAFRLNVVGFRCVRPARQ